MFEYKVKSILDAANKVIITISISYLEHAAIYFDDNRLYKRRPANIIISSTFDYYPVSREQINLRIGEIINYFAGNDLQLEQSINI